MPAWIQEGFQEYTRRMPPEIRVDLVELKPEERGGGRDVERAKAAESERVLQALPAAATLLALDERGKAWTTRELAARLAGWQMEGRDVAFVIGGADGLADAVKRDADVMWSLSPLTLPHGLVRVVLAEQLYRACTILKNHPYHRE